jgi:membrane protein implicated in regulation of membrane protease activity
MNIALLENPDVWLVIGTLLIIVEIFIGSLVLFLPVGIAGMCVGVIFKLQINFDFIIISSWAYALVLWGIISLILSLLIQKYFKKDNGKDINSY